MAEDLMRYGELVEAALRGVVSHVLHVAAKEGLPGDHHFFITCRTNDSGLELPSHLHEAYPEEITLVLQHQFWDLETNDDSFDITLSFNGKSERLHVPFASIIGFVDPSVEFGLQFKASNGESTDVDVVEPGAPPIASLPGGTSEESSEKIVQLDTFRRS